MRRTLAVVRPVVSLGFVIVLASVVARAQEGSDPNPPPPLVERPSSTPLPTLTRDALGQATARATRVQPLRVDGRLDEALYTTTPPMSGFIQTEPQTGTPATERTDVWVSFDDDHVYVTVRAWESQPERMIVNEMRRDSQTLLQNENFAFVLDTYHDRRNGVVFNIGPLGGRMDGQVTNESQYNGDWNPVWELAVGRFEGGWTAEAAVPFKSLRYRPGPGQVWGFNARRLSRWKNEISFLSRVADGIGMQGLFQVSRAATLVGLEMPPGSRSLEFKPYAIADLTSDAAGRPAIRHSVGGDIGVDLKYAVTESLTADLTYNTDFAQVEADEAQINLTRFDLFFPEKREFFLENQGVFQFGSASGTGDVPLMFYSRSIGLDQGRPVPIVGGGRLTGRAGPFSVGALSIQTGEADGVGHTRTNVAALRLKRDVLRRSSVGAIYTRRSVAVNGDGANDTYGFDAAFRFFDNLAMNAYWAQTRTGGRSADEDTSSYRLHLNYDGDRYGVVLHRLAIGEHFNPESGFMARGDISKYFSRVRFSPRPRSIRSIRKFRSEASINYFENAAGQVVTRELQGDFAIEFQNSDELSLVYLDSRELLEQPFEIAPAITIPGGTYGFGNLRAAFTIGQQRRVAGTVFVERGSFYGGDKTAIGYSQGRIGVTSQLAIEPNVSINRVTLPFGSFTTSLVGSRVTYTMTPLMFVSGLVQYASSGHAVSANLRFRWEYRPGSELFLVLNESRDTLSSGFPQLQNRAVIVKINRLLRF